jgi:diacylglycerol kinase
MMNYWKSFLYALDGLGHALRTERNTRMFTFVYCVTLLLGGFLKISMIDWRWVIFSGAAFLAVELLNTALERFVDAFHTHSSQQDDIHYEALKATKDVAAAASLVLALAWAAILVMIFLPYVQGILA